jgi:hypothetical protein
MDNDDYRMTNSDRLRARSLCDTWLEDGSPFSHHPYPLPESEILEQLMEAIAERRGDQQAHWIQITAYAMYHEHLRRNPRRSTDEQ